VRSWKQVTKFRMEGAAYSSPAGEQSAGAGAAVPAPPQAASLRVSASDGSEVDAAVTRQGQPAAGEAGRGLAEGGPVSSGVSLDGLIRDERGVRIAPEIED